MKANSGKKIVSKSLPNSITQGHPGNVIDADYFYFDVSPQSKTPLAIICGGYEKCAPDFEINRINYPYYFIKCTIRGKGILKIKNREYELKPGVLTGFGPGTPHHYIADSKNPMEHIFITFIGTEAKMLLKAGLLFKTGIAEPYNPSEVRELIEKIYAAGSDKKQYSQQICCNYLRILLLQLGQDAGSSAGVYSQSEVTYLQCKKYIDDNFSAVSSVKQIADNCGINPKYLSLLFKKYYRNSPHEYVMRLKLNKAANLLLTSMLSIKEIAYNVGFEDQYHFSRNFKKFHLLSPSDYRSRSGNMV
jgi:AraC family transcriptional regulator of arabinose operon